MPYTICQLPEYPVTEDLWTRLGAESRPIVVYGMGNGADKLFDRLESLGITVSDIFASDGFVRGHSFRGMRVKSLSEIEAEYSDFVILLSFASNRPEVVDMLAELDGRHEMYIPDMPVAGMDEYFDRDFYNAHYGEILHAYDSLADEKSRACFASIVRFKLTGRLGYLEECWSTVDELYSLIGDRSSMIDAGAYNGDTIRQAESFMPSLEKVVAIEPDRKNFKRLMKYVDSQNSLSIQAINAAAHSSDGEGAFAVSGNRNSTAAATASFKHSDEAVSLIPVDSIEFAPDYIKYDVEGGELDALIGSCEAIARHRPALLVSLYHRSRDLFSLVNFISEQFPFYRLYLRRLRCLPAWEIDLICVEG